MDLTTEEFSKTYLGTTVDSQDDENTQSIIGTEGIAASIDWRTKGGVSEVKD